MNQKLQYQIAKAKTEVEQDPKHELSFRTRKKILKELGPVPDPGTVGAGLLRRTQLCIWMVKRVLPIWEKHYPTDDPHRMVALAEEILTGKSVQSALEEEALSFRGGLDDTPPPEKRRAYQVGRGAVCAGLVATYDELLQPDEFMDEEELYNPQDHDHWDCAYWVAAAEAGGMPWESSFDSLLFRSFWDWYLETAVPDASLLEF